MRWSESQARDWYQRQPWIVGCNFLPSSASNQLEMWQAATFDPQGIDRELGWASALGMNSVRVYLHDLAWHSDAPGFRARLEQFLSIADGHRIRPLLVIFDDCWYEPEAGPQAEPRPGVHNSRWVRSPGRAVLRDRRRWDRLEAYVRDVVGRHAGDERVLGWDVYNEVTNGFLPSLGRRQPWKAVGLLAAGLRQRFASAASRDLLCEAFGWVRREAPTQPLTAGIWFPDPGLNARLIELSDVLSFHHYRSPASLERQIAALKRHQRPLLCTEFLAREDGCLLETHLPIFRRERIGCFNWGLVDGRSQTRFSWRDTGDRQEPEPWFHDLLRRDGSPYRESEAELLRSMTREARAEAEAASALASGESKA